MRVPKTDLKDQKALRFFWMRGHVRRNWYKFVPENLGNGHLPDAKKIKVYVDQELGFKVCIKEIESVLRRVRLDRETAAKSR
jgi:hypothetical protein